VLSARTISVSVTPSLDRPDSEMIRPRGGRMHARLGGSRLDRKRWHALQVGYSASARSTLLLGREDDEARLGAGFA